MKNTLIIIISTVITMLLVSGCYLPMTGMVIDAETKAPVEGAVVLVEWTKTKGIGFTYTESYKVAETISDKDGKFHLPGCICVGTDDPDVTIYKKGYVAWNSRHIFPSYKKRSEYSWGSVNPFAMVKFPKDFSHDKHVDFLGSSINSSINIEAKKKIYNAFEWEQVPAFQERQMKNK